jgi:hypothetical protein
MSGPYIQKRSWPAFVYQGRIYDRGHLDEYQFVVQDQHGTTRTVIVTFGDHCFTREFEPGDPAALIYPGCSRNPGCFCVERYAYSLDIVQHISAAAIGKVWLLKEHHFAVIPAVTLAGKTVDYGIVFNLDRVSGLEGIDLHMRVKTAYPFTKKRPTTYGSTRFKVLVDLRMRNKYPSLNTSQHRRW